jgi:AcrR family transcriptional regulator
MPRTRPELDRDEKVAQVLEAGEQRLLEGGFEALSMIGIARDLGVAQNAIYWYFPSRAELFVAVLRHILECIAARKPRGEVGVVERALWWTDQFARIYELRPAMQEQARKSEVVAKFVRELDGLLERTLTNAFSRQSARQPTSRGNRQLQGDRDRHIRAGATATAKAGSPGLCAGSTSERVTLP